MLHGVCSSDQSCRQLLSSWNTGSTVVSFSEESTSAPGNDYAQGSPITSRFLIARDAFFMPFAREADGMNNMRDREILEDVTHPQSRSLLRFFSLLSLFLLLAALYVRLSKLFNQPYSVVTPAEHVIVCFLHDQDGQK